MKSLPRKITPERLKETIVELRYDSDIHFEYLLGLVYDAIKDMLTPVNNSGSNELTFNPFSSIIINPRKDLFQNEVIRFQILESSLVFNSNGAYQGWNKFLEHIQKMLEHLASKSLIKNVNRIGLRYISEFSGLQIFDNLIWSFDYQWRQSRNLNTSFRTEWADESDMIIVNLANSALPEGGIFSIMDVDVNHQLQEPTSLEDTIETIERLHRKEKEVFFGLMRPEFIQSLNPSY